MKIVWTIFGLGLALRLWLFYAGWRIRQFVREQLSQPKPDSALPVTLIAPCKGIDPGLEDNIKAVTSQQYPGWWQVIFVVESKDDPAYELLQKVLGKPANSRASLVVAGITGKCSQKIHNMLAAMEAADGRSEVFAFVDSDVRPGPDWLAYLTEPLKKERYPASSGYRWYVPVIGGLASATRAIWNSLMATVGDPRWRAYAWGGSFAVRRKDLQELGIDKRWAKVLSEDMTLSKMIHRAKKKVAFVVQCMVPSHEDCTWGEGFDFMRRQSLVGRVYAPELWYGGWVLSLSYSIPLLVTFFGGIWLTAAGRSAGHFMLGAAAVLYGLGMLLGRHRRKAVGMVLGDCDFGKSRWMDIFGQEWVVLVALAALFCSALSRKMLWRGRVYTLLSNRETLVEEVS